MSALDKKKKAKETKYIFIKDIVKRRSLWNLLKPYGAFPTS